MFVGVLGLCPAALLFNATQGAEAPKSGGKGDREVSWGRKYWSLNLKAKLKVSWKTKRGRSGEISILT